MSMVLISAMQRLHDAAPVPVRLKDISRIVEARGGSIDGVWDRCLFEKYRRIWRGTANYGNSLTKSLAN